MKTNIDHKKELGEISSLIKDIEGSKQTFAAPSGYFENLPLIINDKIIKNKSQDNFYIPECNASFQNSNSNVELFSAPKNYFSTLPQKIINRIEHKNNMSNPVVSIYFLKYSVAAIAVFLLGAIIFHNLTINDYSEKTAGEFSVMNDANKILRNHRIDEELETVTESDAIEFLTENGHDVNAAIIASLTDNTNLPDEEDYLLNEELLKNYFDN